MATSALLSSVVMGAVLLLIVALVLQLRRWEQPSPAVAAAGTSDLARRANGPLGWSIAFFAIAFGITGLGTAYATGEPVMGLPPATLGLLAGGLLAAVVSVAALVAVYGAVKTRGLNNAQAAGLSSALLAGVFLLAIVARLLMGG